MLPTYSRRVNRWCKGGCRLFLLCLFWLGCVQVFAQAHDGSSKPHFEWNTNTLSLVQSNGYYARMIRLQNGQVICGFDYDRKIWVRQSDDGGKTWRKPVMVVEWPHGRLTNTELLQLRDGSLLCFYNERPDHRRRRPTSSASHRYAICMARSADDGKTWSDPETLYRAGAEFENGCWEPAAIELPSGEVQMFFSNEGPYRTTDEQEITLLRSKDGAHTWADPEKVSFRPNARDGMPVPLVLNDGRGIAFTVEDNGLSGKFKPSVVFTTLSDNWHSGTRTTGSTNRWGALRVPLAPEIYAGAPYLRQMPDGKTILSFQRGDTGELKNARMVVCIGDENAKNFDSPSQPFPQAAGTSQLWNSLFIKNADTVVALSETRINGIFGIWSIEGRLVR